MTERRYDSLKKYDLPLVSVIMNCLNCEKYLKEAIDSVYAQTYPNWEIIFWDNASNDRSGDITKSYDDRLRYFRGEETIPLGAARNKALERAKGEFIAFLDCDDLWLPGKLDRQVPLFQKDERVGLVYSDTYLFNQNGVEKRFYAKKRPYRGYCFVKLLNNYIISLETAIVRKTALDSLSYWFDENFNLIEEYDLFVRIGLDWKIDFVPDALAKWRVHSESWTWQNPDGAYKEGKRMLDNLMRNQKTIHTHRDALRIRKNQLNLKQAISCWKNGNANAARQIIIQTSKKSIKMRMVLVASFFSYRRIELIYRTLFGSVTPAKK